MNETRYIIKRFVAAFLFLFFISGRLYPVEGEESRSPEMSDSGITSQQKKNGKRNYTLEYWLFGSVPAIVIIWGVSVWEWGTAPKWHVENDGWGMEQDSYTGGADKMGHIWGVYAASRIGSYAFEKCGDSRELSAVKGFLFGQLVGLGIEVGDGFGDTYGFAWGDMLWNLGGGAMGLLLDLYPPLDDLIGFQFEYWPSRDHIDRKDVWFEFTSDVSGQKFVLTLKLAGIPCMRETFLQYFQIDFGYYTRGYWYNPSHYDYKSRHAYIGFSFNLSRVCESVFPEGNLRAASSRFFKYYHPPLEWNPEALDYTFSGKEKIVQNR